MIGAFYPGQAYPGASPSGYTTAGAPPPVTVSPSPVVRTAFAYVVTVGSNVVHVRPGSIHITDTLGQVQTADFDVIDIHASVNLDVNQPVSISENMTTIFTGDTEEIGLTSYDSPYDINSSGVHTGSAVGARLWSVRCTGQNALAFRNVTGTFSAEVKVPIQLVVVTLAANLGLAPDVIVAGGAQLPEYFLSDNETYAAAFDRLADLATSVSGITHVWKISPMIVLLSYVPALHFGPVGFVGSSGASVGTGGYLPKAGSIHYRKTRQDFANTVVMKMDKHLKDGMQSEDFDFGNVFLGTLKLAFPMAGQPTITLDDEVQTVGIRDIDTGKDWYWNAGSPVLRLGGTAFTGGQTLTVKYQALDLRTISVNDAASVAAVGIFAIPAHMGDSSSSLSPLAFAQSILARRLGSGQAIRVIVRCNPTAFQVGQSVGVNIAHIISGTFYLRSIRHYDEEATIMWRELELLSGTLLYTGSQLMGRLTR